MLPGFRAVIATVFAAAALLALSFGVAATFRVAQDNRAGSLQADLAQRGRAIAAPGPAIEVLAPLQPIPVAAVETRDIFEPAAPVAAVPVDVLPLDEVAARAPAEPEAAPMAMSMRADPAPPAELPIGGPLEPAKQMAALPPRGDIAQPASSTEKLRAAQKAAAAKKARAARLARERRVAAARRAAQARRAQQNPAQSSGGFNNSFGNSFGNTSFGGFGTTAPRTP